MPTIRELLQSDWYKNASADEQRSFIQENGLTNEDLTSVGVRAPKEPNFIQKGMRAIGRGLASAAEEVGAIALYDNMMQGAEDSFIDPLATKVYDYARSYLKNNPSLSERSKSLFEQSLSAATESAPTSLGYGIPAIGAALLGETKIGIPAALAVEGAVFEAQRRGATVKALTSQYEEMQEKGLPIDINKLKEVSKKQGIVTSGSEVAGDVVTGLALKALPGASTVKAGVDLLQDLFKPAGKVLAKRGAKAFATSQLGEQASEIGNLYYENLQREELGLENQFKEQLPVTIGSTAILGGGMMAGGAAVTAPMRQKTLEDAKNTLFGGIEDASKLSPEQQEAYIHKRLQAASALAPIVEQNLGEDAAKNFMINVVEATKTAVDTSVPNPGALPFNDSIFSGKLDFSQTIAPNQTQDIDPFNTQENPFAKRKAAEDMIKGARQEADAAVVSPAKGDVNVLEEWTQGELFNQMPVSKPTELQDIGPAQQFPVVPEVGQQTLPLSYANPINQQYSNLANLQTQPQTMPVGMDSVSVPSTKEAFVATPPVAVSDPNAKVVGGQTPVTTPQESQELVYDNVKTLDLKLRNPKYLQSLSDGALVQLRTTDMTNVLSPKAIQNVAKEFERRNTLQEQQIVQEQQYAQQPSGSQLNLFEPTSVPNSTLENQNELVDDSGAFKKPFKLRKGANNIVPKGGQLVLEPQAEVVTPNVPVETPAVEVPKKILRKKTVKDKPRSTGRVEIESKPVQVTEAPLKKVATEVTDAPTLREVKRVEKAIEAKKAEVNRIDVALQNKTLSTKKREALETQKENVLTDIDNLELDLEDAQKAQEIINKKISKEAKAKKESAVSEDKTPNKELESLIEDKAKVKDILEHIAETSENKLVAKIAKALIGLNPKVEIKLVEGLKDANNATVMGLYNGVDTITLNKDFFGKSDMSGVFVHELVHHLVSDKLNRKEYSIFRTRLETLKDQVRTALEKRGMNPEDFYGLQTTSDIDEFLAEAMSDLSLQKVLESVKIDTKDSKVKTLFDKFVSIIKDVLGLDPSNHTVLKEVLSIGLELTTQERVYGKALVDHSKPLLKEAGRSTRISTAVREAIRGGVRENVQDTKERAVQEGEVIFQWAAETGLLYDHKPFTNKWRQQQKETNESLSGTEQQVVINGDGTVTKRKLLWEDKAQGETWSSYLDRLDRHNEIFPDVRYVLEGFSVVPTAKGDTLMAQVSQPFVEKVRKNATEKEITEYMKELGFKPFVDTATKQLGLEDRFSLRKFIKGNIVISDLGPNNVWMDVHGKIRVFDPNITQATAQDLEDASAAKAKKQDKSEQALKDAQQRDSIRLVHRMVSGVMDLKDLAVDNFVIPFVRAESGNPVFKKMLELYETRQKNYSNFVFNATLDENGVPVFENAWESYRDLNEEQRNAWKHLLYLGDANKVEYNTVEEANAALKETAENRKRYEGSIDKKTFAAYQQARAGINNAFKSQSAQLFSYLMNSTFGKHGNDVVKAATKAIVKTGKGFDKNLRIAYFKDQLRALELSEKEIDKIVPSFRSVLVQGSRLVKQTLGGGIPGAVPRLRPSKVDNPFVFTLYKNVTNKAGDVSKVKAFTKFFATQGELDAFTKMVNAPDFDIKTIMPFKEVGDIAQYQDPTGGLMITAEKDTTAEAADLFRVSPQDRKLTHALIQNVLGRLEKDSAITEDQQDQIEAQVYQEYTKQLIANTIPRYLSRSKNYIAGFDVLNPLESMMESLSSVGSYVATNDYINNTMRAINTSKGDTKVQLTKEFKNSLTKVNDTIRTFNNVVSSTYLMFKVVTAASQLHQYAVFGMTDLVAQGVPPTKAATLLMTAYARILMHRLSINGPALRKALQGDNPIGRQFRKVPMHGIVLRAMKEAERKAAQKIGSIPSKEERVVFTPDELAMLDEHRINNDTYEGITKEYNTIENSIKDNFSSTLNAYVVKPGMILFNQMEIINREATLLAMYDFQREVKGQSHEVANKAATRFMHRVNGDFSKINKIGLLRKYPNFSMMFQLTSFFFHTIGMMGLYSKDAAKSIAKGKVTDPSVQAMFVMMGMFMALGGAKGSPFADFFNKLFSILFGEDFLLSIEKDINKMVVDKTDPASVERYMAKKVADMFMRGAPAALGIDWSANVALRPPFIDAFIDQAYSDKAPSGLVAGAGPNWITAVGKAAGYAINGEFWRALATAPMGGLSDFGRSVLYSKEGYGSAKGGVSYIGTKQRKLEGTDMLVKAAGFKTTEMAQTQDIINSEYTVIKGYWERNRASAITEFTKALSPYILNNKQVPKEVVNEALESIQEFNKKWMKADKDIRSVVKPIDSSTIQSSIKSRMFPKKKSLTYQIQQTDILDKE